MKENLEQKQVVNETILSRAAAPGAPGSTTPIYLQEYPAITTPDTTIYDNNSAIWDSGTSNYNGYKNVSFANNTCGLQFRSGGAGGDKGGNPSDPTTNNLRFRTKRFGKNSYSEWNEIYHTGNLDKSIYATKTSVDLKADRTYVDSKLAAIPPIPDISSKADKTYVDNALSKKADKTYVDNTIAEVSSSVVCAGLVNNSAVSCSNSVGATSAPWGNGNYTITLNKPISGVVITPITSSTSNSAKICASVYNTGGSSFSVSITKDGQGYDCSFYFMAFKY